MHQHLKSREGECINRSIRDTQKTRGRAGTLKGNRQEAGQLSIPKTELVRICLPRLQPKAPDNHGHSRFLECAPWKFRQVSYLWKIDCCLVSEHCYNQSTNPNSHTHLILNLALHPMLSSLPPSLC